MAKEPVAGRVKTRLCPPFDHGEAALLAGAALADTLAAAACTQAVRRVLALDGAAGSLPTRGWQVVPQRGSTLDERIAGALEDVDARLPVCVIGMDTPQVTGRLLDTCMRLLLHSGAEAALGSATDGGWWALALRRPDPAAVLGVPMSTARTGRAQMARLVGRHGRVATLPRLTDVDTAADAWSVARTAPGSRFARELTRLTAGRIT